MSLDDRYKINSKTWIDDPLHEIAQMLNISDQKASSDQVETESIELSKTTAVRPWSYDQHLGYTLNHLSLLDELFLGRDVQYKIAPWGSVINWGNNHLNLYPAGQRCRSLTKAQQGMYQHGASVFFERWYDWVHDELKHVLKEKEEYIESSKAHKGKGTNEFHLYVALRKASLRVIARTVCASFVGDVINKIASALEEIDVAGARLLYCGKGSRPSWFPGSETKVAQKGIKSLDALIRPLIRKRLAGEDEDDLLSRWVNTQGEDGRHLNEDQIISEAFCFLMMSYTSLPKIIFSADYEMEQAHQEPIRQRLQKEHDGIIEVLTPPPGGFPAGTPLPHCLRRRHRIVSVALDGFLIIRNGTKVGRIEVWTTR